MKYKGTIGHFRILLTTVCIWGKENLYLMPLCEYTRPLLTQTAKQITVMNSTPTKFYTFLYGFVSILERWNFSLQYKTIFYDICKYLRIVWTEVKRLWQFFKMVGLLRYWNKNIISALPDKQLGPPWSWSYGSWIYNYLCSQCLSPLMLWVRISFKMAMCIWYSLSVICDRSVLFSRFPPSIKLTPLQAEGELRCSGRQSLLH